MIHEVGEKNVERKETGTQEEIVHGMQVPVSYSPQHNQCGEEE